MSTMNRRARMRLLGCSMVLGFTLLVILLQNLMDSMECYVDDDEPREDTRHHRSRAKEPSIAAPRNREWVSVFYDDFAAPEYNLTTNFHHPMSQPERTDTFWKWDGVTQKQIHWHPSCSRIVASPGVYEKPVLRVAVYSAGAHHRIDRLATRQQFGYGLYEARLRFRGASGMHSAFWLLPASAIAESPAPPRGSIRGGLEIDVVEHRRCTNGSVDIRGSGSTALHWGGYGANHTSVGYKLMPLPSQPWEWATFALWHFDGGIRWFWNGVEVGREAVWSPVKTMMLFSTEVGPSTGWAGRNLLDYGSALAPEGYLEVDYCAFWDLRPGGIESIERIQNPQRADTAK